MSESRAYTAILAALRKELASATNLLASGQTIDFHAMTSDQIAIHYARLTMRCQTLKEAIDSAVACWNAAHNPEETKQDAKSEREVY